MNNINNNLQVGDWVFYTDSAGEKITSIDQILPFKVDCKSIETSKEVQEILFSLGCDETSFEHKYLFVSDSKKVTYVPDPYKNYFNQHKYQEIPVELLLWLEEQNNTKSKDKFDSLDALNYALYNTLQWKKDESKYTKLGSLWNQVVYRDEHQPNYNFDLDAELNEIEKTFSVDKLAKDIPVGTYFIGTIIIDHITTYRGLFHKIYNELVIGYECDKIFNLKKIKKVQDYKEIKNVSISYMDNNAGKTVVVK